jgi:hypothetical protein
MVLILLLPTPIIYESSDGVHGHRFVGAFVAEISCMYICIIDIVPCLATSGEDPYERRPQNGLFLSSI